MTTTFTFNGRVDVVVTIRGQSFLLRGEGQLATSAASIKMSYAAPSFRQAIEVGTIAEIVEELGRFAKLPNTGAAPKLDENILNPLKALPGFKNVVSKLPNLQATKVRITEMLLEVKAPLDASALELPPGKLTIGLGLELSGIPATDRDLLGITLESVVLTLTLDVARP